MNNALLEQWLKKIESIHPKEVELGLRRVTAVADALRLLPVPQPVVTVAGTNGKGSVVALLETLLAGAGYTTGAFTSPHFLRFNERIHVAGAEVSDAELVDALARVDAARGGVALTYFEFATLAALLVFRAQEPDIVILEVGLGGRLDAVNMVDPTVAVITSIDLDHQDWLGTTRGDIAREKAGIMRRGVPVVIGETDPPPELLRSVDRAGATPALLMGRDFRVVAGVGSAEWAVEVVDTRGGCREYPVPCDVAVLPENIATALQTLQLLQVAPGVEALGAALARAVPVGRRQARQWEGREIILDVAHNPAAVNKLLEYIDAKSCSGRTIALFSMMADKDIRGVVERAVGHFDAWFLADQPGNPRAAQAEPIAVLLREAGASMISVSKNLRQALGRARQWSGTRDRLVVFGSFFTVASVLPRLDREQGSNRDIA
ncbi:MAG: bifunctional folylpolyglutamate synthase/dihydrofolate synthase [Halioglobus sp.]|nr:bifunctional folylpolyglutamate synthase/dihydrofolate synthase [Halioglobus sp.]